jgi:hypothetical protein
VTAWSALSLAGRPNFRRSPDMGSVCQVGSSIGETGGMTGASPTPWWRVGDDGIAPGFYVSMGPVDLPVLPPLGLMLAKAQARVNAG